MNIAKAEGVLSEGMVVAVGPADPRVGRVLGVLATVWPDAFLEAGAVLTGWYPVEVPAWPSGARGHFSGAAPEYGWVYSSVNDILGGAEGILHEMGHHKLKEMGVWYEHWTAVLANDPGELYVSPIRKDKLRPMGAVLHAYYSYLYVTEFDRRGFNLGIVDEATYRLNQGRIAEGVAEVERYARPTPEGKAFLDSVIEWGHALQV
jgi:HEXXH motif-containing protein